MLKPGFLLQVLPVVAIILAAFFFIIFKMLTRYKPREDNSPSGAWFEESLHPENIAPELKPISGTYPVRVQSGQDSFEAVAKEISLGGAFIICDQPLSIGDELTLTIDLGAPLELKAAVTWNNSNVPIEERVVSGMRVRFLDVTAEARAALTQKPSGRQSQPTE